MAQKGANFCHWSNVKKWFHAFMCLASLEGRTAHWNKEVQYPGWYSQASGRYTVIGQPAVWGKTKVLFRLNDQTLLHMNNWPYLFCKDVCLHHSAERGQIVSDALQRNESHRCDCVMWSELSCENWIPSVAISFQNWIQVRWLRTFRGFTCQVCWRCKKEGWTPPSLPVAFSFRKVHDKSTLASGPYMCTRYRALSPQDSACYFWCHNLLSLSQLSLQWDNLPAVP